MLRDQEVEVFHSLENRTIKATKTSNSRGSNNANMFENIMSDKETGDQVFHDIPVRKHPEEEKNSAKKGSDKSGKKNLNMHVEI